ncbi:MAG: acetyl-CoA carboxylase biotin carboxylase subunit [Myxococcota bacterium]
MFRKLLVANRSEIARRVMRTARRLGIATVAVYSEADQGAPFVTEADEAICIGPPPPRESYLNVDAIIAAARQTGADAVHPGYGFLSESEALQSACAAAGIVFVGPPREAIRAMGGKIEAKRSMERAGVPVVPWHAGHIETEDEAAVIAEKVGYPIMLKTSAGGGGIGMHRCDNEKKLRKSFEDAKKKGEMFFGSSEVFLERYVESPHHIEVQILADQHGKVLHLFDRECSVQRRHQKLIEEAPSPFLTEATRAAICEAAVKAAAAVGYTNAGTVEFVVDSDQQFYFLEMNTRLQVEHPVTEAILGLDIVEWQLRVAAGERLPFEQSELRPHGHAIELRVCAEDPEKRFFPSPGALGQVRWPAGPGIRVDAGVETGGQITPFYDSLIAKLIGHGPTREEAIARLEAALAETQVEGVATTLGFHRTVLAHEVFRSGHYDTGFIADVLQMKY